MCDGLELARAGWLSALLAVSHWLTCDLLQDWALSIVGAVVGMGVKEILKSTTTTGRLSD